MIARPSLLIYAKGGPEVTTRSRFLKQPDAFREDSEKTDFKKVGKGGSGAKLVGDTKSKPVPKGMRK